MTLTDRRTDSKRAYELFLERQRQFGLNLANRTTASSAVAASADRFHVGLTDEVLQQKLIVVNRQDANSLRLHSIRWSQSVALLNMPELGRACPPISGVAHEAVARTRSFLLRPPYGARSEKKI